MIGYTPSHLTKNEVILEKLNQIIDYLSKNPSYQVFAYNGNFVEGALTYAISNIIDSSNLSIGDVVIFENSYYGVVSGITETEFTLTAGISLIGPQGAKGDKGDKGDYGTGIFMYFKPISQDVHQIDMDYVAKISGRELQNGDILFSLYDATLGNIAWVLAVNDELRMQYICSLQGPPGSDGSSGLSTYFVNSRIDSETESVPLADLVNVVDRNIRTGDILISSHTDTFGGCAVVTAYSGVAAYLNYIGSLRGTQGVSVQSISIQEV